MEVNEIMNNEQVIEVAENVVTSETGKGFKTVAGVVGAIALVGALAYGFVIRPIRAKKKSKDGAKDVIVIDDNRSESEVDYDEED